MSYSSISQCANDPALQNRVTACCAQENTKNPASAMSQIVWPVSCHADIEAAYESALLANHPDPGGDPSVITDQMILSAVQPLLPSITP